MEIALELLTGGWNLIKIAFGWIGAFLKSLDKQGVIGLIAAATLAFLWLRAESEARHWHKQSNQYQKLYQADEGSFQKIAAKATTLKQQIEKLSTSISQTLKDQHDAKASAIDADARSVLVRGPGAATCASHPATAAAASGRDQAAPAAANAGPQVPSGDWAAVPWDWLVSVVTEHDQLLNDDQTYRTNDQRQRQSWPSSSNPVVNH